MPASRTPSRAASGSRPTTATRPGLSPHEAQAVREALALRQALAAGRTLTPEQAAVLRTATAAATRTQAARTGASSGRPQARRKPAGRPAAKRGRAARPATGPRTPKARTGSKWSTRLGVVAMSTLLLPAVASMVLPGADEQGPNGGHDVTSLALTARTTLLEQAGRYRLLEQQVAQRRTRLEQARAAEQAALAAAAADDDVVGAGSAALYRAAPAERYPALGLDVHDSSATVDALYLSALAERADQARDGAVVRAQRTDAQVADAARQVAAAETAVAEVTEQAADVLAEVRATADGLAPAVTAQLAALGTLPASGEQQERNEQAVRRWQDYLGRLDAGGIVPPSAAELADPAGLPAGLSPALDAQGQPVPGIAWAVIGSSPVTVLPAEAVAAVSSALSQLGRPFVSGTAGPDSYDCGGFTSAAWLLAGYAVPTTPHDQWAAGTPVAVSDLQIGDLVFSPGGQDVGIYLGDGDVVGASAATYQVGVRSVAAGSSATRVTLGPPAEPNAALPAGAGTGVCGAPLPKPGPDGAAWGGWSNGRIPADTLCALGVYRHALRCDAAAGYGRMSEAFEAAFGSPLCITDSYRSYDSQVSAFARKPKLAAVPGTSNHGWALAVDLCGGINVAGTPQWKWMTANAGRFGFLQPDWAQPGSEKPEPWHWEFGHIS